MPNITERRLDTTTISHDQGSLTLYIPFSPPDSDMYIFLTFETLKYEIPLLT